VKGLFRSAATVAAMLSIAGCNGVGSLSSVPTSGAQSAAQRAQSAAQIAQDANGLHYVLPAHVHRACGLAQQGFSQCELLYRDDVSPDTVSGLLASDLQSAYNLPSSSDGAGQVVAIVDAYDNPDLAVDFAAYRSYMGLPAGSLTKYNQEGVVGNYPQGNTGWGEEMALDVEMVSASCPLCTVIVVEGNSNSNADLGAAVDEAVKLGANVVSNSYSGGGSSPADYNHKGVVILASAGDSGYGIADPADFPSVVAVGGTHLVKSTKNSRGWGETVWSGTGGGCSTDAKPKWQKDPGCKFRTGNDIAAVADPNTGVAFYDTYGMGGWGVVGGTSVSSPLLAGVFGLAANEKKQDGGKTFYTKKAQKYLNDITFGSNGSCSTTYPYLCNAETGYDSPTGWGTPNGIGAF
jgi:subtilase family serine protease